LTLKEAANESGIKRSLLFVAIGRGVLPGHRCGRRTIILMSDFRRLLENRSVFLRPSGKYDLARRNAPAPEARSAGAKSTMTRADARALNLAPVIAELRSNGLVRPQEIANELSRRRVFTSRGSTRWGDQQVRNLLARLDRLQPSS
jgi:hypothetical protein